MPDNLILRAAATADDLANLRAFVLAEQGEGPALALDRHLARPRYRPDFTRVAVYASTIVGYALIGHERLRLGTVMIEAGRLEHVYVRPDRRGQGLFRALIGECLGMLVEQRLPIATLRGPRTLFTAFGFAPYCFSSVVDLAVQAGGTAPAARPATEDDLEDLAALHEASYRDLPLSPQRVAPDWRWWLQGWPTILVIEDRQGRVAAYAVLDHRPRQQHVIEAAAADSGAARTLITALIARAGRAGVTTLQLALPPTHLVAQAALHLGGSLRLGAAGPIDDQAELAGIVDLPATLEALAPEYEQRLAGSRYAGWSGTLRIEIETERICLVLGDEGASVIDGSRPADVRLRRVTLPGLAQLCLGYRAAADLRATADLDCDDSALGLIDALFPVVLACSDQEPV